MDVMENVKMYFSFVHCSHFTLFAKMRTAPFQTLWNDWVMKAACGLKMFFGPVGSILIYLKTGFLFVTTQKFKELLQMFNCYL